MYRASNQLKYSSLHVWNAGFSLIELLVAIVLGLLLTDGIITLFNTTSGTSRVQNALALLQENGRFATTRIMEDLRMGNYQYCSTSGGSGLTGPGGTFALQDSRRSPMVYANNLVLPDAATPTPVPPGPPVWPAATPYPLSPRYFLQGYDCSTTPGTCTPALPATFSAPAQGTTATKRVNGTDVLTLRYLQAPGWSVNAGGSSQQPVIGGNLTQASITPAAGDPPITGFVTGHLAMLADCSGSAIFGVNAAGTVFTPNAANFSGAGVSVVQTASFGSDARLFDFSADFVTITYFLQLNANTDASGGLASSLMRSVNGAAAQEIVQGVERMTLRYGIEDANGATQFLTATQIESNTLIPVIPCPPPPQGYTVAAPEPGCLWRAVKSIEVYLLVNSINDVASNSVDTTYRYTFDNADAAQKAPAAMPVTGLPSGRMMRREFRTLVSLRNNNS